MDRLKVIAGNSNPSLAEAICQHLQVPLSKAIVKRFSDGEIMVEIHESVRGMRVFVVQSTCDPVNSNIMELLILIDALKRASASEINAVIPYYGYARQDRKVAPRAPITAKLMADLLTAAGANRVIAMDLHAGQIQGFFNIPVDHLYALPAMISYVENHIQDDMVVVSPDAGGVERARAYAKKLGASLAIIDKRRSAPNVLEEEMNIIGDIEGKVAVIIDDMIDTAGTLTKAANVLMEEGAAGVYGFASHGVLSGPAIERIATSRLAKVVITDSIPLKDNAKQCDKIVVLSVAGLLADAIKRIYIEDSVSCLFV
ncbi:MAG: ribose-phosphate pyrophosphokinase [Deltaproteobacteria bacterium]|nr:ribose-phosphate pyrophosphokinase [Candidatus Anaeroferrophillus wilburensis]MBN2888737.1 ribose-phosphate pyrophosphokinase [Deltaproteobacteria bacterium]